MAGRNAGSLRRSGRWTATERGLSDVVGRDWPASCTAEVSDLSLCGRWAHQHAVAAGPVHFLHHQLAQVVQHVLQVLCCRGTSRWAHCSGWASRPNRTPPSWAHRGRWTCRRQCRCPPHWHRVTLPALVGAQQARHNPGVESGRNDEQGPRSRHPRGGRSHPPGVGPLRGSHEDEVVFDEQVLAFHQLHAHLLGQEGVLEVGRCCTCRGSTRTTVGLVHTHAGETAAQGVQQQVGVMGHRGNAVLG